MTATGRLPELANQLDRLERSVRSKDETIRLALVTLFARGHLLIEDVPGAGKTALAPAVARSFNWSRRRSGLPARARCRRCLLT